MVREESDGMWIEETVKSWTDMLKHKNLLFGEVRWRDHSSQTIAGKADGIEEHVARAVIYCSQEDFIYIVKQVRRCLEFKMTMEFRDREIVFLGSIANSARGVDNGVVSGGRFVLPVDIHERVD